MKKVQKSLKQRVIETLADGAKHNVAQLTILCHTSDPRSLVRDLRREGYNIKDEWVKSSTGARYKNYWLEASTSKLDNND